MADRVLVPVDGSAQAHAACDLVFEEFPGATVVLLHVINPAEAGFSAQASLPTSAEEWYQREKQQAEKIFDEIRDDAEEYGVTVETHVEVGKPTRVIVEFADDEEIDVDHIVMGSHGRGGVSRVLLGSVAETVVRRSPVPVTVTR